jgi:hypothetical protein
LAVDIDSVVEEWPGGGTMVPVEWLKDLADVLGDPGGSATRRGLVEAGVETDWGAGDEPVVDGVTEAVDEEVVAEWCCAW